MAKGKANGVNATKTSFPTTEKQYGNSPGSRLYQGFSSIATQEPLATQFPERPTSRESIASQDDDAGGYTAKSFESQEGLATQSHPPNTGPNLFNTAHAEPTISNGVHNMGMLLGLLDKGHRRKPSPEHQSQRSVVEFSSGRTEQTPITDSVTPATQNNLRDWRSPSGNSVKANRPKRSPKQQPHRSASNFSSRRSGETPTPDTTTCTTSDNVRDTRPPSEESINGSRRKSSAEQPSQSPNPPTSSDMGTNNGRDGQEDEFVIQAKSKNARNSSQRLRKSSETRTSTILADEVTSFQVHLPSSSDNTAPIAENDNNPFEPPKEHSDLSRTRLNEPARKEKSSHRDPWSNMKKIRRMDIVIPKEQEELLERKDCWIPPDVGQPYPQGHVPPTLLWEWNTEMTRLFADARKTHASSQKADPSREQEDDQPHWAQPLSDDSESGSEAEFGIPWTPSPPRDQLKSVAPPDSPTRQNNDRRPSDLAKEHTNGTADGVDGANLETQAVKPLLGNGVDQHVHSTHGTDISPYINQEHDQNMSPRPLSTVHSLSEDHIPENEADELSDDSDMEVTVPQALIVNSQDIASEIEFSGPLASESSNLNSAPAGHIQILNTPAAALKRAAAKTVKNALTHSQDWAAQQSSSGSNKSSSQLIANSLNSAEGSSGQEHQVQDAQRPLVADSQITSPFLQGSSLSSHLDSQRLLETIPNSSLQSPVPHAQVSPQRRDSPEERAESVSIPSTAVLNGSKPKRRAAELDDQVTEESPCKRARKLPDTTIDVSRIQTTVDVDYNGVNESNYEHASLNKDGLRVYDMFKRSYPRYAGNFDHFQALCFDLHSLNRRGVLKSSFLWDDFIMKHWVDYGTYVQRCISSGEKCESYEDFFCRTCAKPSFRKRNLTTRTLNLVVSSRLESSVRKPITAEREMQTIDDNSVSASVIRHLPLVVNHGPKTTSGKSNTQSTASDVIVIADKPHQANIGVKLSASPKKHSIVVGGGIQVDLQPPTPSRELDREPESVREAKAVETPPPAIIDDDIDREMREINPEDSNSDYHDTASIELGLDVMEENLISHGDDEAGNDADTVEARFEKISRMRRDEAQAIQELFTTEVPLPPEEEDASTPFKIWARDDHNIVSERRRRGGYEVPLDKDGNIVFEEFPKVVVEKNEKELVPPFRRWIWPGSFWNRT